MLSLLARLALFRSSDEDAVLSTVSVQARMGTSPLIADLRHMTAAWDASPLGIVARAFPKIVLQPRFRAVIYFRSSHWAWQRPRARTLAYWLQARAIRAAGTEIHPAATIGPGLQIAHSVGIVVGHEVVAGSDLVLYQGVTIGHRTRGGQPTLGDRVRVGAGAKVLGPITIGNDVKIGANAVVLANVPAGLTVSGVWNEATAAGA
jgi:serine O-acetyltransferase